MKRELLKKLKEWKAGQGRKPLLLKGARQVGKTWLLKHFGEHYFPKSHYLNFEKDRELDSLFSSSLSPKDVIRNYELAYDVSVDKNDLMIFDEVQESPSALTSLKYFSEEMPELAVCAAGSHIGVIRSSGSFPVGKIDDLTLFPLSFSEFLEALDSDLFSYYMEKDDSSPFPEILHKKLWQYFLKYYITGGMPEAVSEYLENKENERDGFSRCRKVHEKLLFNYVSDFSKHAGVLNASHIHSVFEHIPQYIFSVNDESVSRFKFKGVIPGKSRFSDLESPIDWLINAGFVYRVSIVEKSEIPLRHFRKPNIFKLMLFDTGLLNTMLDVPFSMIVSQDYGTFKGYSAENYASGALVSHGFSPLYSWHGRKSEIEFIFRWKEFLLPLEVKSGSRTRAKSLSVYSSKYSPKLRIIASAKNLSVSQDRQTLFLPLYCLDRMESFLEKLLD